MAIKSKRERFVEVASKRVQKVLDDLDNLSKCSNKGAYEYSDQEVSKMLKIITAKVNMLKLSFTSNARSSKDTFKF